MAGPGKLGYLVPQFPGQTHTFFWREIIELERRGIEPVLFSTRPPHPGLISHRWSGAAAARTDYLGRIAPSDLAVGLMALPWRRLVRLGRGEPRRFWRDVALSAAAGRRLKRRCTAEGITHVHAHSCGRAAMIAALSHAMGGPAYSLTLHGPLADYGPGQRFKWSGAAFATVITERLAQQVRRSLSGHLPRRLLLQPMGVDTDHLSRDGDWSPPAPGEPIRLFSCARLNPVKGHADVLATLRLLRDEGYDITLRIAGEDDAGGTGYRAILDRQIEALGLSGRVTLLGAIDADAVRDELLAAHAFVLASHAEPLGVAYMEAMSCEVPTIGTNAGGVPELISHGVDGILVPPRDPVALAGAVRDLVTHPDDARRLGRAGRARIVARFNAGHGAETLIEEAFGPHGADP